MALSDFNIKTLPKQFLPFLVFDGEVLQERWDACNSCEFLTKLFFCKKCFCCMKVKTRVARMKCPVGKWGKYGS